jgi:hypothetical protein
MRAIAVLLVPRAGFILDPDLVAQQHFRAAAFPAAVARAGQHESTRRVDVDGGYDAAAVARDDSEGDGAVAGGVGLRDVVDAEDIV